jgi:mono/diheme cytochrome c family protein
MTRLLGIVAAAALMPVLLALPASPQSAAKLITVTVTDTGFRLSARTAPVGTVTFAVVNAGKTKHDFKIAGKKTPILPPGKGAKLVVSFTQAANYLYTSTVAGDAARGLKGIFSLQPATTVAVTATDVGFRLSSKTAPIGPVGFAFRNAGKAKHNFSIAGNKTPVLSPGMTATLIVNFGKAGSYAYTSTVPGDAARGLKGVFTVKSSTTPGGNAVAGKQVFLTQGCGACHILKAAGATGTIGTNLDTAKPSLATIVSVVTNGRTGKLGTMPVFKGTLSTTQIQDVAAFIYASTH